VVVSTEPATVLPSWATLLRADNPSPMTLEGTNTYVLRAPGATGAIVVDPGPLDERHLGDVAGHGPVALILLTHGHPDHAEGARLLQEMTGAPMAAADRRWVVGAEPLTGQEELTDVGGLTVRVLATPGHTADSVCFAVPGDEPALLTGDTILGRGTAVVAHPDGRLGDYLASLGRIRDLTTQHDLVLLPGHGPASGSVRERTAFYLTHRAERVDQVRAAVAAGAQSAHEVVRLVYADVDEVLWPAAEQSVQAALDYLAEQRGGG
jgi:glyoxylase-like metal-dependent hydrolase (beta-lactamase superfamily II)